MPPARPLRVTSVGSLFNLHATDAPVTDYRQQRAQQQGDDEVAAARLLNEGVMLSPARHGLPVPADDRTPICGRSPRRSNGRWLPWAPPPVRPPLSPSKPMLNDDERRLQQNWTRRGS